MDSTEEYAEFLKKVERTIYVDNISPDVTESVLKASFDQFGNVTAVQFIPLSMQLYGIRAALVEMVNMKQAKNIVSEMNKPFMICGMPRPVRVKAAVAEMFVDRPREPGRQIRCRWLDPRDPKCKVAKKIKEAVKRHAEEDAFLLEVMSMNVFFTPCLACSRCVVIVYFCAATTGRGGESCENTE